MKALKEAALEYARAGLPVLPIKPKSKAPKSSHGVYDATNNLEAVEELWNANPDCGIGIRMGEHSGVVVFEVDPKNGGLETLEKLEAEHGPMPETLTATSGGGGKHYYFCYPGYDLLTTIGKLPGIDVICGNGSYVVAAPSIHPSGNRYQWDGEFDLNRVAEIPDHLKIMFRPKDNVLPIKKNDDKSVDVKPGQKGFLSKETRDFMQNGAAPGTWNNRLFKAARDYHQNNYTEEEFTEAAEKIEGYLDYPSQRSIRSAFSKDPKHPPRLPEPIDEGENDEAGTKKKMKKEVPPAVLIAKNFLLENGYQTDSELFLHYWKGEFYRWDISSGHSYQRIPYDELEGEVIRYLEAGRETWVKTGRSLATDVISVIRGKCIIPESQPMPGWLNGNPLTDKYVLLKNGILSIDSVVKGAPLLQEHSSEFFSLASLPYDYQLGAKCPRWIQFLNDMVPDKEVQDFLQEWMGYNLVYDVEQQKFVILHGKGANGKSVICLVLRLLLGDQNVSAVGLEAFSPTRTFPLASTFGKLANIIEEMGSIESANEGILKQFVSGGFMTIERKGRDPFTMVPSARVTMATNVLPKFKDTSDGLWRRLISVPMPVQILDESKQDKRLASEKWWKESGELPGIFLWALEGLKRLRSRGRFIIPAVCLQSREEYKREQNPTRDYILDHYEYNAKAPKRSVNMIYSAYRDEMLANGNFALSKTNFGKELKEVFKELQKTENAAVQSDRTRSREWIGLGDKKG